MATSITMSLSPGSVYRFRVQAMDGAGNYSEWTYGSEFVLDAHQETQAAQSPTVAPGPRKLRAVRTEGV